MNTVKTAVSLPADLFKKSEKLRKKLGKSRSALFADALARIVREEETRTAETAYAAAYAVRPETPSETAELRAWGDSGATPHENEDWGDAPR